MNVIEAIKNRRTIRAFKDTPIETDLLLQIVDCARMAPFAINLQPLKYKLVTKKNLREKIFPLTKYAGFIPEWNPSFSESATAYIIVLNDTNLKPTEKSDCDSGAALATICLAAYSMGIDSCILGSIDKDKIKKILSLDDNLDITYVVALGYGAHTSKSYDDETTIKYSMDKNGDFSVPKRPLKEILV